MIDIKYSIINDDYDQDSFGKEGFFQMIFNGNSYGEFYSGKLENVMGKVSVFNWFERLLRVVIELKKKDYVILSDTESIDRWIEFEKRDRNIIAIGIIRLRKLSGTSDIEYINNSKKEYMSWYEEFVSYDELKYEVCKKATLYSNYLKENNCIDWRDIHKLITQL